MKNLTIFFLILIPVLGMAQKPKLVVPIGPMRIQSLAFSPNGQYILTGSYDNAVKLWDSQGLEVLSLKGHQAAVRSVCFSPDGKYILTGSADNTARLWDPSGREVLSVLDEGHGIVSVAFSPDSKYILTGNINSVARLWDLNGKNIQYFQGHEGAISSVDYSPDGKFVLTGSYDKTGRVWNLQGKNFLTLKGHSEGVIAIDISPDLTMILTGSLDNTAKIWDANGKVIHTLKGHTDDLSSACFSPDGTHILTGSKDGTVKLWNSSGKLLQTFSGHTGHVSSAVFSPNGKYVLSGSSDLTARVWDLKGQEVQRIQGHANYIYGLSGSPVGKHLADYSRGVDGRRLWNLQEMKVQHFQGQNSFVLSPDGQQIVSGYQDGTLRFQDLQGNELQHFQASKHPINYVCFAPGGDKVITKDTSETVKIWNLQGEELHRISIPLQQFKNTLNDHIYRSKIVSSLALSPDGKQILSVIGEWSFGIIPVAKSFDLQGQELRQFYPEGKGLGARKAIYSPSGQFVLTANSNVTGEKNLTATLWDLKGKEIRTVSYPENLKESLKGSYISSIAFSPDGKYFLTGTSQIIGGNSAVVILWDLLGRQIRSFKLNNTVYEVGFSPDGRHVLICSRDKTLRFYNRDTGEEIAALVSINEKDWVITTPSGLFDATPEAMRLMHFVKDLEVIELEQLKERYYEPGLLPKLLGFQEGETRDVAAFNKIALYPISKPSIEGDQLNITLTAREGGIGKVSIFINNKEVIQDANPSRKTALTIDLKQFAKFYTGGENKISLRTYNSDGWLKSAEIALAYSPAFAPTKGSEEGSSSGTQLGSGKVSLFAISIGTADYSGDKLDLTFAGKDAISMETAFKGAGGQLFQDRVNTYLLSTEEGQQTPSKANIKQVFQEIAIKAQPQDIVLVYLSGHGVTYGPAEKAHFYYLTKDIGSEDISDTEIRNNYTISDDELTTWMTDIPALKQVMIVDACNSGKVVENLLAGKKKLNSTQVRALDRMKDRTGMFVLAGSAADKVSYEASQYGQGLLTYSLLSGMSGRATGSDGRVDVMKLFQFSRDEVPTLAKSIKGIQTPMLAFPTDGSSFDIGIVNGGVNIPVSQVKPVFVRCNFLDIDEAEDVLEISDKLNLNLEKQNDKGANAALIYINTSKKIDENSYSIKGTYEQSGTTVNVKGKLRKGSTVVHSFSVTGNGSEPDALVKMILKEVTPHLGK